MTTAVLTEALFDAQRCASRHVLSERTNDVKQVMETVSQTVCYMMPNVTSPDHELMVLTERDDVRDFYAQERTFMEVIESTVLVDLTSDWYTFLEAVSTTRQVATGTLHQNDVVVLFPVADDGIIGEILLARRAWTDVYACIPAPPPVLNPIGTAVRRAVAASRRTSVCSPGSAPETPTARPGRLLPRPASPSGTRPAGHLRCSTAQAQTRCANGAG